MATWDVSTDASLLDEPSAESTYRDVNGVRLHVVAAGDEDDPLVVLLHGFPEFWYCWHRYVGPFVEAEYRVLVPDLRGYNLSDRPPGVRPYALSEFTADVVGLVDSEGRDAAHVVGHDVGAAVGWDLALRRPERVDRLGIVNVPHPTVYRRTLRSNPRQALKSSYVLYFQLPRLPEWVSRRTDFRDWVEAMDTTAEPGTFTATDWERYRAAWRRPGAPRAMLNWYRATVRHRDRPARERVRAPTMVAWGEQDVALLPEMAPASVEFCEDGRLERFPEASHWIHHERPDELASLLFDHLGR